MLFIILVIGISAIVAQQVPQSSIDEVFPPPNNGEIPGYEDVTKRPQEGFGALDKCGEGSTLRTHVCVPYYMCDGVTNTVVQSGKTDGFGIIDIRFGANSCEHPLDVCCKVPQGSSSSTTERIPDHNDDTTSTPVVTSENPPQRQPNYCGIRNDNGIDFKITGNKDNEAEYGEFPWMVAILKRNRPQTPEINLCGGSLIAPNVILTGAHCVYNLKTTDIKIRAGEWDTKTDKERLPYQERDVVNIIIHNDFNSKTLYNDVALVILEKPFKLQEHIGTICLPDQNEFINSKECYVTGWGKDKFGREGEYQVILKKIKLPLVQHKECEQSLRSTRLGKFFNLDPSFICAGGLQGKDSCKGDGGGPLVCPDPRNRGRYVQAGIVAWGIGCGEDNIPGVYADVAKVRHWIDDQMRRLNLDHNSYIV